ncbi:DUF7144 family membrane protein [Micromonospora halophytica]|uniref:DUF7144 family membrane protein n=1 Tax=Micromonospora halophytica TaxID=47864 RepID=UPI000B89D413|nr:hypothetical protein [Micromonospora halophytica]
MENRRPALLAGALVGAAGLLDFLAGFATTRAEPYVVMTNREMVHLHTAAWGRLHLLIGLAALVAGLVIALGPRWATVLGLGAVAAGSVADLLFLPYDPLRELLAVGFEIAAVVVLVRNRRLPGGRPGRRTRA